MKISGIQKLSLVDFEGKMATTIFTSGCNFACPFCHNSGLVKDQEKEIPERDILEYLEKRKGLLDGVCISGGEPTIYKDLPDFIEKVKNLGYQVKLDTNGTNPEMIKYLVENNLIDYIAMDIKNSKDNYHTTTGKNITIQNIEESIKFIMTCGIDYEFRTTLVATHHTDKSIQEIGEWIAGAKKYYLQKFEDSGNCLQSNLEPISHEEATHFVSILQPYINNVHLRGY